MNIKWNEFLSNIVLRNNNIEDNLSDISNKAQASESSVKSSDSINFIESNLDDLINNIDYVCLYFSAHWCGPCRKFTPQLMQWYSAVNKNVEIIFVSNDCDEEMFEDYFSTMPWYALPFDESKTIELRTKYEIKTIPSLVVFDKITGDIISKTARNDIPKYMNDPFLILDEWSNILKK